MCCLRYPNRQRLRFWLRRFWALWVCAFRGANAKADNCGLSGRRSAAVRTRQIGEARKALVEEELDLVGGAMAMLLDQDLGAVMHPLKFLHPLVVFGGAGLGFARLQIIFLAVDEHHHVGVLFDRARLP